MIHVFAGSVTGRDHRRANRDGQDGFALVAKPDVTAAIVTDGCSSGTMSEVGARLGAVWIAELVAKIFSSDSSAPSAPSSSNEEEDDTPERAARQVTVALIERLRDTARSLGSHEDNDESVRRAVAEMLLFGFLAAVVTPKHAIVFGVGDGMVWIDGRAIVIDPGPENAPLYAAYALLGASIEPRILYRGDPRAFDTLAIATDGAEELLEKEKEEKTVSFEALIRDDRLLTNPSLLRKRLLVLSDRGMFFDDTTIGVIRRKQKPDDKATSA